jgi:hypothetical protein
MLVSIFNPSPRLRRHAAGRNVRGMTYPPTPDEIAECERRAAEFDDAIDTLPPGPQRKNAQLAAQYWYGLAELFREHLAAWAAAGELHASE